MCPKRLDLKNVGGIKTNLFLRLIDYKPNQIDEFGLQMDLLRTKSCIVDQIKIKPPLSQLKHRSKLSHKQLDSPLRNELKSESISYFDRRKTTAASMIKPDPVVDNKETTFLLENPKSGSCETSLSEAKIKSMVSSLKNNQRFGFNDDLVVYLNNRV